METYKNLGGDSNVESYEIAEESITVVFRSGRDRHYLYTYNRPGKYHVEEMKSLARNGRGLNSYISRVVKSNFEDKW